MRGCESAKLKERKGLDALDKCKKCNVEKVKEQHYYHSFAFATLHSLLRTFAFTFLCHGNEIVGQFFEKLLSLSFQRHLINCDNICTGSPAVHMISLNNE